jgi:hypothetical protein
MLLSLSPLSEAALAAGLAGLAGWLLYQRFYVAVPPNKALILFGQRSQRPAPEGGPQVPGSSRPPRVLIGGGTFLAPWNKAFAYLPLAPIDVEATVRAVHSVEGGSAAGWEVVLAVQAKIPSEPKALRAAAENLIGLSPEELGSFVRRAVEASVPLVLARLGVGDAEPDWEQLGSEIQATVAPELVASGLTVRSVSVRDLRRIAQGAGVLPAPGGRPRTVPALAPPSSPTGDVDLRLARIERGLTAMGLQVDRWLRERPVRYGSDSLFDPAPGPGPAVVDAGDGREPYDSMEERRAPRPPRPFTAARESGGAEPPPLSDGENPR